MIRVAVGDAPIAVAEALEAIERVADAGAVASFTGLVRADDGVTALTLEHYPGMTERTLDAIARAACDRWALKAVTILHRVGTMRPGERIVFVGVAAGHRQAALDACTYCIDRLKTDAPFWKREAVEGVERWVEAREGDRARADRWE
jgi:molybdopterin synthase catalytic subunit